MTDRSALSASVSRRLWLSGAAALGATNLVQGAAAQDDSVTESQQGDPSLANESISFSPGRIRKLTSPEVAAELAPRIEDFPTTLIATASEWLGKSRENAEAEITEMLNVFGIGFRWGEPPRLTAFCAAGVSYCATLAYARAQNLDLTSQRIAKLRRFLIEVGQYHFYPTVSVIDMWKVADGTRRTRTREQDDQVRPGWLVVYNWSGSNEYQVANHVGLVESYDRTAGIVHTIEFNTCAEDAQGGSQGNGGQIVRRNRHFGTTIKGFINTAASAPF